MARRTRARLIVLSSLLVVALGWAFLPRRFHYTSAFLREWASHYTATLNSDSLAFADSGKDPFFKALSDAALERPKARVRYDGRYFRIPYPMGDVPPDVGVCTDEVVRSYRAVGVDLQQLVHEDMVRSFKAYPNLWGRTELDSNIDHRRVPILMHFFSKYGKSLPTADDPSLYGAGDIVVWQLMSGVLHIGLVVEGRSIDGVRPLIVHNIGAGPKLEDALFCGRIVAHFRYRPTSG